MAGTNPMIPPALLLLPSCWLALFGIAYEASRRAPVAWSTRQSFLLASIAWGSILVLLTEVSSVFGSFARHTLMTAWTAALTGGVLVWATLFWRRTRFRPSRRTRAEARPQRAREPLSPPELAMLAVIGLQAVALLTVACVYPPNNYDSMTYHMARVMHWQQHRSVAYYATDVLMQLQGAPFAEFVIAHLQILTGGDRFANLVQWFAMIVCAVGVSDIVARLGADRARQIAAAALSVSIPMGVLQATSTQNDYVVASWLVCFVAMGLPLLKAPTETVWIASTGLALGLALLTKQTAFIYAAPFVLMFGWKLLARLRDRAIGTGVAIAALLLLVNAGVVTRNVRLMGTPLWPPAGYVNDLISPASAASNMIRNTATHVPLIGDAAAIRGFNRLEMGALRALQSLTGLSPTDPRTSMTTHDAFAVLPSFDEDVSGNPLHLMLIGLAIAVTGFGLVRRRSARYVSDDGAISVPLYVGAQVFTFVLFSAYLRWQLWQSRLQLPHFVLWCPAIAILLFASRRKAVLWVPVLVTVFSFNWTFNNATRPLSWNALFGSGPRSDLYFAKRPDLIPIYNGMADAISASGCHEIGLAMRGDPFEYPVWMLLEQRGYEAVINHIQVTLTGSAYPEPELPCAVVSAGVNAAFEGRYVDHIFGTFHLYLAPSVPGGLARATETDAGREAACRVWNEENPDALMIVGSSGAGRVSNRTSATGFMLGQIGNPPAKIRGENRSERHSGGRDT